MACTRPEDPAACRQRTLRRREKGEREGFSLSEFLLFFISFFLSFDGVAIGKGRDEDSYRWEANFMGSVGRLNCKVCVYVLERNFKECFPTG